MPILCRTCDKAIRDYDYIEHKKTCVAQSNKLNLSKFLTQKVQSKFDKYLHPCPSCKIGVIGSKLKDHLYRHLSGKGRFDDIQNRERVTPLTINQLYQKVYEKFTERLRKDKKSDLLILDKVQSEYISQYQDYMKCEICYKTFNLHDHIKVTKCKHRFHNRCLQTYILTCSKCNICKKDII